MSKQKMRDPSAGGSAGSPAPGSGGSLKKSRQKAKDLLAVGDDAIKKALSSDSEAFLASNRQQGGE